MKLKAPFPYFGGKSKVAHIIWKLLGKIKLYIEPCFGSGAVLLNRPDWKPGAKEIVNDYDCMISNFWRSIKWDPEQTAYWADWPVNHADLCARRYWLQDRIENLRKKIISDPDYYDPKIAGWWVWCASIWIGSEMLTFRGEARPHITFRQGIKTKMDVQIPHLTGKQGIQTGRIPRIAEKETGIKCQTPDITDKEKRGVKSKMAGKRPNLSGFSAKGVCKPTAKNGIEKWFFQLQKRFENVDVICGDWSRVCGGNWQTNHGVCGIFFDPPYGEKAKRKKNIYTNDNLNIAEKIREWCLMKGTDKNIRIVLAGYYEEHESLLREGWKAYRWTANGGYSNCGDENTQGKSNRFRETLFYSPHCLPLKPEQPELFGGDPC